MNQRSIVSIALATYNGAKFLRQFLNSIVAQTWADWEIIACDDGSTDETVEILKEYQTLYPITIFVNPTHLGHSQNFGKAISLCEGTWIALADQDDIWERNKLEILVKGIQAFDVICSDAVLINADNEIIHPSLFQKSKVHFPTDFRSACLEHFATGCTMLITKEYARTVTPIPASVAYHDYWIALLAFKSHGVKIVHQGLVRYRQHGNNVLGAKARETLFSTIRKLPQLRAKWEHSWKNVHLCHFRALKDFPLLFNEEEDQKLLDILIAFGEQYIRCKASFGALIPFCLFSGLPYRQRIREVIRLILFLTRLPR